MRILFIGLFLFSSLLYSKTMMLDITYDRGKLHILKQQVYDKNYPSSKASFLGKDRFLIKVKAEKDETLEEISLNNPLKLYIPPSKKGGHDKYQKPILKKKAVFRLVFKFDPRAKMIEVDMKALGKQILFLGGK